MSKFEYYTHYEAEVFDQIPLPRLLFTHPCYRSISVEGKVLYALMWERTSISHRYGWIDSENRSYVYFSRKEVSVVLNIPYDHATSLMNELEGIGLVERQWQEGLPTKNYLLNFASIMDEPNPLEENILDTI